MRIPKFLTGAVKSALPIAAFTLTAPQAHAERLWSDPATWSGTVPGPTTDVVITGTGPVILNVTATVKSLKVSGSTTLRFSTTTSQTLYSKGNVIVEGTLEMKPSSASQIHTLKITEADEGAFVGGGMDVLATDRGLWVMEAGKLDLLGTQKTPWIRAAGSIAKGASTVALKSVPSGWEVGDEVSIAPTSSATNSSIQFDLRTITLSSTTSYAHPDVTVSGSQTLSAEVMNLTRNVRIEGMQPATETPVQQACLTIPAAATSSSTT